MKRRPLRGSQKLLQGFTPVRVIAIGFFSVIFIGALLLTLPFASSTGQSIGFINALFSSTTAVCVTGLVVVDTGTAFTLFGQIVIMLLIQIGGLGFMTLATVVFMALRKRITLRERVIMQEAMGEDGLQGLVKLTRRIIAMTLIIEGVGAILLMTRFIPIYGFFKGFYFGIFHAVSAFCNAGLDLVGGFRNLTPFVNDPIINFTVMSLIVLGGLGFAVILDVIRQRKWSKLRLHSRMAISMTGILLFGGALLFFCFELSNPKTIGSTDVAWWAKPMAAMFQSVTTRTAGFNTIDIDAMTDASKLISSIWMFIGAAPASTGGGIKVTTFAVLILTVASVIRGRNAVVLSGRTLSSQLIQRSLTIVSLALGLVLLSTLSLTLLEARSSLHGPVSLINIVLETTSAFGTVGLSASLTPFLKPLSKLILIFMMYAGRIGPLTLMMALAHTQERDSHIHYPEAHSIIVG